MENLFFTLTVSDEPSKETVQVEKQNKLKSVTLSLQPWNL